MKNDDERDSEDYFDFGEQITRRDQEEMQPSLLDEDLPEEAFPNTSYQAGFGEYLGSEPIENQDGEEAES